MLEVKYPVKYALLPIKARRTNKRGEEFFIDECYIVSKAYVLEEHRKYLEDGTYSVNYKICFPYVVYTDGINLEKRTPRLHSSKDYETTSFYLYDSLEDAKAAKEKKNVLISESVVEKYQPFEDSILELTEDMVVDNKERQKIKYITGR